MAVSRQFEISLWVSGRRYRNCPEEDDCGGHDVALAMSSLPGDVQWDESGRGQDLPLGPFLRSVPDVAEKKAVVLTPPVGRLDRAELRWFCAGTRRTWQAQSVRPYWVDPLTA